MTVAEFVVTSIVTFALVGLIVYVISVHTEVVRLARTIASTRARIDVLRARLLDELPKLVKVCERDGASNPALAARLAAARRTLEERGVADAERGRDTEIAAALEDLVAASEANAGFQSSDSFQRLLHRIGDLECQIEELRNLHDETAIVLNARIEGFVERHVARWLSVEPVALSEEDATVEPEAADWARAA